ncbi:hypothetical protein MNBD_NITROSPINAE02-1776 [hydrothermal vent metagenome]|uniref:Glycosyltransferase 2-like domain-containing protein n=1 Tax=hydrothermal vent metagenome TaxID=652676 RepID=A0A3B1CG75_9ZZZZ
MKTALKNGTAAREKAEVDGRVYDMVVKRDTAKGPGVPRLIIPSYQPAETASAILKTCIKSIQRFTSEDSYELWVVDNNSPLKNCEWLLGLEGVNVALSRTEPVPPQKRGIFSRLFYKQSSVNSGSYANAIGLELGLRLIDPSAKFVMTLHMDTMACRANWLEHLQSKLGDNIKASGVCMETHRTKEGVLHVLGLLMDYQLYKKLGMSLLPELPQYDVGDRVTVDFEAAGYGVATCPNTYEQPELAEKLSPGSGLKDLRVVRAFDDDWNVIFLHLGRGIPKSQNEYKGKAASAEEWFDFAKGQIN